MSYASIILQTMRAKRIYGPEGIYIETRHVAPSLDLDMIERVLKMLHKENMIELVSENRFKRKIERKYKTNQRELSF